MRIDRLAIHLRLGTPWEAADLGTRLCQREARGVYRAWLAVLLPVAALCGATVEIAPWLPGLLLWWAKPWLDRTILHVLARAAFGTPTTLADLWAAQRQVWWSQWWRTWIGQRLSASRACTQPILQLEGQRGTALRRRLRELQRGRTGPARLLALVYSNVELALAAGFASLWLLFAPTGQSGWEMVGRWFDTNPASATLWVTYLPWVAAVALLEPFFVASGFGMYLNRRVELEAWDIEQDLRHAFAS
jgi:hypothetical protein